MTDFTPEQQAEYDQIPERVATFGKKIEGLRKARIGSYYGMSASQLDWKFSTAYWSELHKGIVDLLKKDSSENINPGVFPLPGMLENFRIQISKNMPYAVGAEGIVVYKYTAHIYFLVSVALTGTTWREFFDNHTEAS